MLGTSFVNPCEYFKLTAQQISKPSAITRNNQCIILLLLKIMSVFAFLVPILFRSVQQTEMKRTADYMSLFKY